MIWHYWILCISWQPEVFVALRTGKWSIKFLRFWMFSCWQVLWFTFKSWPWRWRYDRIVSRQRGRTEGHPREREYWPSNTMLQLRHSSCPFLIKHLEAWNIKITLIVGFKPKHYDGEHCQDAGPTFFAVSWMPKMSVEQIIIAVEGRWTTTLTVMFRSKTVGQNEKNSKWEHEKLTKDIRS